LILSRGKIGQNSSILFFYLRQFADRLVILDAIHRAPEIFQDLRVRRLPPCHVNVRKRLVTLPRISVRDSGLVHALLGIRDSTPSPDILWWGQAGKDS